MTIATSASLDRAELTEWVKDARERTLALASDLTDEQWMGPRLSIVNPMRWELGHIAWFAESWVLRHAARRPPLHPGGDSLYDSSTVPHDVRWDLPLPDRSATLHYLEQVRDLVLARIEEPDFSERDGYFVRLAVFHEDMHDEAFAYTRQTLGYPAPRAARGGAPPASPDVTDPGDARVPGGTFRIGAERPRSEVQGFFVFDNEKWAYDVEVPPFSIARTAVSQGEFARFVDDGGYVRRDLWTDAGWAWRVGAAAEGPVYWRRDGSRWLRRHFDRWVPLEPRHAALHVNAFEAEAYCRWAKRRLPTEAEWEVAASGVGSFGCRELRGEVWQWTSSPFEPYPGFVVDPYKEYSAPWFRTHRVLRGGCAWTQPRLLRNTWRNFYTPDRRDVWAGFRTCALP